MHVTCSNCGARYAVDATAIGPTGRTVQCVRCNHRWFQKIETAPAGEPPAAPRVSAPSAAPDFVIRPPQAGSGLPALAPPPPRRSWGTWLSVVIGLVVLVGLAGYAYREDIKARLPAEWRSLLNLDAFRGMISTSAKAARTLPATGPRLDVDVGASRIELVDGRYIVHGEVVNTGGAPGSTRSLKLVFRAGEEILGERTLPLVEGPLAPGARAGFSIALDDPPPGTTNIVPTID
jgi:predicted Zn finger-like uncharacterized protein